LKPRPTELAGVVVFSADLAADERGYFARLYERDDLAAAGIEVDFPQWSVAANERAGTVRGLHFAAPPHAEAKLVRVIAGAIYDVVVDLRAASPTFGRWIGLELREAAGETLFIPAGFAHGYQTLADRTYVAYGISRPYVAAAARGINAFDTDLGIAWPLTMSVMSERDRALPTLARFVATGEPAG
jgi:dTDP-4-dehydrorhamnose 3,5-epimerase